MRITKVIVLGLVLTLCFGCKSVSINQESQRITKNPVILSGIGLEKDNIIQTSFGNTSIPEYRKPIRVIATSVAFNAKTHKAYVAAASSQQKTTNIAYIDSLPNKLRFISLRIADHVDLISELNNKHNTNVKDYLANNNDAIVVTNISLTLPQTEASTITNAQKVFLVQDGTKGYALQLKTNNTTTNKIMLNSGVIFAYRTSSPCWQEKEQEVKIVDLVDGYRACPDKTYRSAKRAKKNINYFKL